MGRHPHLRVGVAVGGDGAQTGQPGVPRLRGDRIPAELADRGLGLATRRGADQAALHLAQVVDVEHRGSDAVHPGAPVLAVSRGEGGAAELLGIQAKGRLLGVVLAHREGPGNRLGGMVVAESGEICQFGHRRSSGVTGTDQTI